MTLLFADLCNYTALTEMCDPEEVIALRQQVERLAERIFHTHGGTITQVYGDGILGVFGLPTLHEREVQAAIDTALSLRDAMGTMPAPETLPGMQVRMHFGVHCGLCFVRLGDRLHGRYLLAGDAVNTAARLCGVAEADEIVVSKSSLAGLEPLYELEGLPDLELKGKEHPVPAWRVLRRSVVQVRTRFEASKRLGFTTFVSRDRELSQLLASVDQLCAGQVRITALLGTPGIGKSRLLEELVQRAHRKGQVMFRGYCERFGSPPPLQPFVHMIQQVFKLTSDASAETVGASVRARCEEFGSACADFVPEYLRLLSLESEGPVQKPAPRRERPPGAADSRDRFPRTAAGAMAALFQAITSGPVVLAIDDWQWADEASLDLLHELIELLRERGVLVLLASRYATSREGLHRIEPTDFLELSPLTSEQATAMIRRLLPAVLEVGLVQEIYNRSGGNPLYLEELCRALPRDAPAEWTERMEWEVPHTIQGVIQARLTHLPETELRLLRTASVVGCDFSAGILQEVLAADKAELFAGLDRLTEWDFIRPVGPAGDSFQFKHGIARDAVYTSVRLLERRKTHGLVAVALATRAARAGFPEPHAALAYHYQGSLNHFAAAHHAEAAGDKALSIASLDHARGHYQMALGELDRMRADRAIQKRWLIICSKWARAWVYKQSEELLETLQRAISLAEQLGDHERLADAELMSAWTCYALGDQVRSIEHSQRGIAIAEAHDFPRMLNQCNLNLAQSYAAAGDYTRAVPLLVDTTEAAIARAHRDGRPFSVGIAYGRAVLGVIEGDQGDFVAAERLLGEAMQIVSTTLSPIEGSIRTLAVMVELWRSNFESCLELAASALVFSERIRGPYLFMMNSFMASYARCMLNPQSGLLASLRHGAEWLESRGMGLYLSMVLGCVAEAALRLGERESAMFYARRAIARARRRDPFGLVPGHLVLAQLAQENGRADEANDSLRRARAEAEHRRSLRCRALVTLVEARLLRLAGDLAGARLAADSAQAALVGMAMPFYVAEAEAELSHAEPK